MLTLPRRLNILVQKCGLSFHRRRRPSEVAWLRELHVSQRLASNGRDNAKKLSSARIRWFWIPPGLGFVAIAYIQLRHIRKRERRRETTLGETVEEKGIPPWQVNLFKIIPTNFLSKVWGKIHDVDLPEICRGPAVRFWTWAFDCCLDEAEEEDPSKYPNLGAFFIRKLKNGMRNVELNCEMVCPVDGKVIHFGRVIDKKLEQVKGVSYSVEEFLGPNSAVTHSFSKSDCACLQYCVIYLGPGDCHHIHSPTDWFIKARRHFSGKLFSVSPWVLKGFPDVLSLNERVALYGLWKHGTFTMTAVGAYNVGSIIIHFDKELKTNSEKALNGSFKERIFTKNVTTLSRGDPIGWFAMGSAIVLVFEAPEDFHFCVESGQKVLMGQALGVVPQRNA